MSSKRHIDGLEDDIIETNSEISIGQKESRKEISAVIIILNT